MGTLGDLTKRVADLSDPTTLSSYFNLNIVSCMSIMCANMIFQHRFFICAVYSRRCPPCSHKYGFWIFTLTFFLISLQEHGAVDL